MRLGPLAFPWWSAIVAAAFCVGGVALGNWQSGRAAQKRAIADRLAGYESAPALRLGAGSVAADDYLWRKVEARGEFDSGRTLFLGNRLYHGQPGFYIVTPLHVENSPRYVLVLRGWMPSRGSAPPADTAPQGVRVVGGLAIPRAARIYEPGSPGRDRVRQNVDLAGFEQESGLPLYPFFLEQRYGAAEGLVQDWPAHDALLDRHRMYAGQWYALAGLAAAIFVALSYRHGRRRKPA